MPMQPVQFVSAAVSVGVAYASTVLTPEKTEFPDEAVELRTLLLVANTIVAATTVTWFLTAGGDVDKKLTEPVTSTLETTQATAGEACVVYTFGEHLIMASTVFDFDTTNIYVHYVSDGTFSGTFHLIGAIQS